MRAGGRQQARVDLTLREIDGGATVGGVTPFELLGPLDVAGLVPQAVVRRMPAPGAVDASETRLAQVEIEPPDLPWRYTPEQPAGSQALKPWLALVVAKTSEATFKGQRVVLAAAALAAHDLGQSARWAHVHTLDDGKRSLARILSPRDLEGDTDYVAVVVPTFAARETPEGIGPAWDGNAERELDWYDRWSFRTAPDGDFETIVARLRPVEDGELDDTFGVAKVAHPDAVGRLPMRAALAAIPQPGAGQPDAADPPAAVGDRVQALTEDLDADGHWVLSLPGYDEPWPGAGAAWRQQFRRDPRRRGAAGLGAWAGIEWQDRISDAAAAQGGAFAEAAQRIRHLTLGLAGTRSLWDRRFPGDPVGRLALLGPALARIPEENGTVLDAIDGRVPGRLVRELFSSAARRVLRAGPARTALAQPGAGDLTAILKAANVCQDRPPRDRLAVDIREALKLEPPRRSGALADLADAARARLKQVGAGVERFDRTLSQGPGWLSETAFVPPDVIAALDPGDDRPPDLDALSEAIDRLPSSEPEVDFVALGDILGPGPEPPNDCWPFESLDKVGEAVVRAVDPHAERPIAVERVTATIHGLEDPVLAPPDLSPELDLPLWKFLNERERDWLLPGVGQLGSDRVVMVQTNPAFVDAFLVGANHQTLGELRWRNIPIRTGWTPLRRFWSRFPAPSSGLPNTDINGVATWPVNSTLGDQRHRTDPTSGEDLVVVLHTELFRRYPATLVYLYPRAAGDDHWQHPPDPVEPSRRYPIFSGSIGPEIVFFGFRATPAEGRTHWVVLEEPPPGFRFYGQPPPDQPAGAWNAAVAAAPNGAKFAEATFAKPVRVFLGDVLA